MDHIVQGRDLLVRISDDWIVHPRLLRLINIVDPALVRIHWIHADGDDFHATLLELRCNLRYGPQLGRADRGIVFRVREEYPPPSAPPASPVPAPLRILRLQSR